MYEGYPTSKSEKTKGNSIELQLTNWFGRDRPTSWCQKSSQGLEAAYPEHLSRLKSPGEGDKAQGIYKFIKNL